jgi:hypothetical protein
MPGPLGAEAAIAPRHWFVKKILIETFDVMWR